MAWYDLNIRFDVTVYLLSKNKVLRLLSTQIESVIFFTKQLLFREPEVFRVFLKKNLRFRERIRLTFKDSLHGYIYIS